MDIGWLTRQAMSPSRTTSPEAPAVSFEGGPTWTYRELHHQVNRYANALLAMGVGPGDRVGILMQNAIEYLALYLAVARCRAIAVRINFRLVAEELSFILHDASPAVLCLDGATAQTVATLASTLPVGRTIVRAPSDDVPAWAEGWDVLGQGSADEPHVQRPSADDPVMLMYTSGTTGRPKGALWSHDNLLWFAAMQRMRWGLGPETAALMTGPMYHVGAIEDVGLATLLAGGHVILMQSRQFDIQRALTSIETHRVTDAVLFPFMIYSLLHRPEDWGEAMRTVRHIYSGGDPVLPWATAELSRRMPHAVLTQVYGLTEGTPIITSLDGEPLRPSSVGTPLPLAEVRVMDDKNQPCPVGEVGEIWTHSPVVALRYWNSPEATSETFRDGWCRTGDLGYIDDAGYLYVVGRKKDMIRSGGENVYPAEVEDVLMRHPGVQEVAVIGVPDAAYLEAVCAIIVRAPDQDLDVDGVVAYCRQHLASYKKPRHVLFAAELPRTPSGKVQKQLLRERWQDPQTMRVSNERLGPDQR